MINQELINYIQQSLNQGIDKGIIKNNLLSNGWLEEDIESVFKMINGTSSTTTSRLLSFRELWTKSLNFYKSKLLTLAGIALIPYLISLPLLRISFRIIKNKSFTATSPFMTLMIVDICVILLQWFTQISILYAIKDYKEQGHISILSVYYKGLKNFWNYLVIMLFIMAIIFAIPSPFFFIGLSSSSSMMTSFSMLLGAFLLFVPGLIFLMWFIFSEYILVIEGKKGLNVLSSSKSYISGKINATFSRLFGLGFYLALIMIGLELIMIPIKIPAKSIVLGIINISFLTPFALIFTFFLYDNLRDIRRTNPLSGSHKLNFFFLALIVIGAIMLVAMPLKLHTFFAKNVSDTRGQMITIRRQADLHVIQDYLELYYTDTSLYPSSLNQLQHRLLSKGVSSLPQDPITKQPYHYEMLKNGQDYKLCSGFGTPQENCVTSHS